jgi:hypothetical protein
MSMTFLAVSPASRRSTNLAAFSKYSRWISSALASRLLASRTLRRQVMSWEISRIARIGLSSVRSRRTVASSTIASTRSVAPTLRNADHSDMFESPTITCSRR